MPENLLSVHPFLGVSQLDEVHADLIATENHNDDDATEQRK